MWKDHSTAVTNSVVFSFAATSSSGIMLLIHGWLSSCWMFTGITAMKWNCHIYSCAHKERRDVENYSDKLCQDILRCHGCCISCLPLRFALNTPLSRPNNRLILCSLIREKNPGVGGWVNKACNFDTEESCSQTETVNSHFFKPKPWSFPSENQDMLVDWVHDKDVVLPKALPNHKGVC